MKFGKSNLNEEQTRQAMLMLAIKDPVLTTKALGDPNNQPSEIKAIAIVNDNANKDIVTMCSVSPDVHVRAAAKARLNVAPARMTQEENDALVEICQLQNELIASKEYQTILDETAEARAYYDTPQENNVDAAVKEAFTPDQGLAKAAGQPIPEVNMEDRPLEEQIDALREQAEGERNSLFANLEKIVCSGTSEQQETAKEERLEKDAENRGELENARKSAMQRLTNAIATSRTKKSSSGRLDKYLSALNVRLEGVGENIEDYILSFVTTGRHGTAEQNNKAIRKAIVTLIADPVKAMMGKMAGKRADKEKEVLQTADLTVESRQANATIKKVELSEAEIKLEDGEKIYDGGVSVVGEKDNSIKP